MVIVCCISILCAKYIHSLKEIKDVKPLGGKKRLLYLDQYGNILVPESKIAKITSFREELSTSDTVRN